MQNVPVSLNDVIINAELRRRPSSDPDNKAERDALIALSQAMADEPQTILQKVVEMALDLCRAETAGISLLENHGGEEEVGWEAFAGVHTHRNGATPGHASPGGTPMHGNPTEPLAQRVFPTLKLVPPLVESLVMRFDVEGTPIGTLWVVAGKDHRKFDGEDERNIRTLAQFASAAWQLWKARATAAVAAKSERERASQLATGNGKPKVAVPIERAGARGGGSGTAH